MTAHKKENPQQAHAEDLQLIGKSGRPILDPGARPVNSIVVLTPEQLTALVSDAVTQALTESAPVAPPEVLDVIGAGELLNISRTTLHRLREGGLPHYFVGDSPRFLRSDLLRWIASNKSPTSPGKLTGPDRGRSHE